MTLVIEFTSKMRRSFTIMALCLLSISQEIASANAQELQTAPILPVEKFQLAPRPEPTLRIGAYMGALSEQSLFGLTITRPWAPHLQSDSLAAADLVYTAYRFTNIPLDVEIEGGVAKHYGWSHQTEFNLLPMARWKYFPWNEYVYTNFRLGLAGVSYDTSVPEWEKRQIGHYGKTSRFLSFLVPEFTFSPSKDAPFEVFVRVHHRSGIYGVIIKDQSSNYLSAGVRFSIF
jgi:hypothetical protein